MPRIPFTPEQIQRLLATAKGDMFGLVLLGAFTGQRLMDIATLSWRKIDLEAGVIRFNQSKGDKDLPMPIHPQVAEFLLTRAGDNPDAPLLPELARPERLRLERPPPPPTDHGRVPQRIPRFTNDNR